MNDQTSELNDSAIWDIHKPVARRTLILCATGAILGLIVAGFGLFTAQGTRIAGVPAEDAALVNGIPILRADLIPQVQAQYTIPFSKATPAQKQKVLNDMVREELYVQRGVEMGLPTDDIDVRAALVQSTEALVSQDAMTVLPPEDELQKWYATHSAEYSSEGTMTLHEWVLPANSIAAAQTAIAGLRSGGVATSFGLHSSGRVDDGQEYYFAARIHLGPELFAIARKLQSGAISEPVSQPDGIHILQVVQNTLPVPTSYKDVRDRVLRDYLAAKVAILQAGNEKFLRKRADIQIAGDLQ